MSPKGPVYSFTGSEVGSDLLYVTISEKPKTYRSPRVERFGSLTQLTAAGSAGLMESVGTPSMPHVDPDKRP